MQVRLHQNARTTPATRREMQASTLPTATLARQYNVTLCGKRGQIPLLMESHENT